MDRFEHKIVCCVLVILGLLPTAVLSCTCAEPWGDSEDAVIEALCAADVVFVGKVIGPSIRKDDSLISRVEPTIIFKGGVIAVLTTESSSTCDHWYSEGDQYLIFGLIEEGTTRLSTSICGPTRFTRRLEVAESQLRTVRKHADQIDELCGESKSTQRRSRMLEEGRDPGDIDYDRLLKETRSIQEDDS